MENGMDEKEVRIVKRIVKAWILGVSVSVFFTGCNSLSGSMNVDVRQVGTSVAAEDDGEQNGVRMNYSDEDKKQEAPDYFEENMQKKFENLEGKQAFRIKDGHSQGVTDFQIGGLKSDKTFIYGYATEEENSGGGESGKMVHCGAFYNYENGAFQIFHENVYDPDELEEGQESFLLQACMSSAGELGDIFIYDNGFGYIYNPSGGLKFQVDLDNFIRRQYPGAYSLTVVNAMTDGDNRIYMEVSVEKEKLDIEAEENADQEESEEDLDEEAEHLEQEVDEKVEEVILVYEFQSISSDMIQDNENFENQCQDWINRVQGQSFSIEPDPEWDWKQSVQSYPDSWGSVTLTSLDSLPMYQWKNNEEFSYEANNGVCTFLAKPDTYRFFTDLKGNTELEKAFYAPDGHYSRIYGKAGELTTCNTETISRTYTYTWIQMNEENEMVSKSEERTQTIERDKSRHASLEDGYRESFWNLDREKAYTLGNSIGSDIICCGRNGKVYWIRKGGTLEEAGAELSGDLRVGVIPNGTGTCVVASDADRMYLGFNGIQVVEYKRLGGGYQQGSSQYDQRFEEQNKEDMPEGVDVYEGSDYYTEENVLRVDMAVDQELATRLCTKEPDSGWPAMGGTRKGFLLSSRTRGLIFYEPMFKESLVLSKGTWYRSFLLGGKCISVGFMSGDTSYGGLDVAQARVYEYDLNTLCREMMTAAYNGILEKEEADRIAASEAEAATESSTEKEGVEDPMEKWNEEYREKHQYDSEQNP